MTDGMRPIEEAPDEIRSAYGLSLLVDNARQVMLERKSYWACWSYWKSKRDLDDAVRENRSKLKVVV